MRIVFFILSAFLLYACSQDAGSSLNSKSSRVYGMDHRDGFLDLYVDGDQARVLAYLPKPDIDGVSERFIYTARLTAGLGSNPVGLDRGWGDSGQIVLFRKLGDTVIIEAENMTYRASADNDLEKTAVRESFARSFLASAQILEEKEDGRVLVDLTSFLTRDALNLVQYLKDADQGSFSLAKDRTLIDTDAVFAFPDNVEVDVFLTLSSADPGREVATTAANGLDATLIQHHSFVRLPEVGYAPLRADPRSGAIEEVHYDYSAPLEGTIETRLARRYRLIKTDKDAAISTVEKPIVFYIDSGAPEPIRSALVEGASWWKDAFEAAGYENAYRVEILPEGAHPLDIRYNVVQWVHRQTRGWSYGGGVSDPRTGEMLKGHVNLGSLRVRQDRMIFEGLAGTEKTGSGEADDPSELALSRIRQLSAHEVGHALGFAHNFAASTVGNGSVMDYPAPNVSVQNGKMDFSKVYGVGVGDWDKFAATWLYGDLDDVERSTLVDQAISSGLRYVADTNARSAGTGHPDGNIWDNGVDPVQALNEAMNVRRLALSQFGPSRLQAGQARSDLNKMIVPLYLYHRYQVQAAAKVIGGARFNYALVGDGQPTEEVVPAGLQVRALRTILNTLSPDELDLSDETLSYLTPSLASYSIADSERELFKRTAYPAFDVTTAADTAANMTFSVLLHPRRAARMIEFKRRDRTQLGFSDMLSLIRTDVMNAEINPRTAAIAQTVQARFAYALMDLINADAGAGVKARANAALIDLSRDLGRQNSDQADWMIGEIDRFLSRPATTKGAVTKAATTPPGGPIGMGQLETCWHCEP